MSEERAIEQALTTAILRHGGTLAMAVAYGTLMGRTLARQAQLVGRVPPPWRGMPENVDLTVQDMGIRCADSLYCTVECAMHVAYDETRLRNEHTATSATLSWSDDTATIEWSTGERQTVKASDYYPLVATGRYDPDDALAAVLYSLAGVAVSTGDIATDRDNNAYWTA